jgi:hypothetical protein
MAIRKLKISFEIDVETLAKVLAYGNSGMNIEVLGTDDKASSVPRVSHTGRHPAAKQMLLLEHLVNGDLRLKELQDICAKKGFSRGIGSCMDAMLKARTIKRVAPATYSITEKGRGYVNPEAV